MWSQAGGALLRANSTQVDGALGQTSAYSDVVDDDAARRPNLPLAMACETCDVRVCTKAELNIEILWSLASNRPGASTGSTHGRRSICYALAGRDCS